MSDLPLSVRWANYTHREQMLGRIDPSRWPQVESDLDLVDQLERRLSEMGRPDIRRGTMTMDMPLQALLREARASIVHWHQFASRSGEHARPGATD